ncbi:DUF512 domain-containing protein [Caldicellulosiruptoraceae bacterium PP1]
MLKVTNVKKGSLAEKIGINLGDYIISINNIQIYDLLDYMYASYNKDIEIIYIKENTTFKKFIRKKEYQDLGIEFEDLVDKIRGCENKCIFCFIDQLPKGLRDTLYIKDDDSRLSLLTGNYITLTNLKDKDFEKIIKYHISPLKISVHTTNPELRVFMLKNKRAALIKEQLKQLSYHGIEFDTQIVLVKNVNDGKELKNTIEDLSTFFPNIKSISVVPVGLTKYRENLYDIKPFDKESSLEIINTIEMYQRIFLKKYGTRLVYAADEFFINAGLEIKSVSSYEDFRQIENGVGMVSLFIHQFKNTLSKLKGNSNIKKELSIATGQSAYNFLKCLLTEFNKKYQNINIKLYCIENKFFGNSVTVSGLLTGQDIIEQLKNKELGSYLLLPDNCINYDQKFLDDVTVRELENQLNIPIFFVPNNGRKLIYYILKGGENS